jgi:hypothetical protein
MQPRLDADVDRPLITQADRSAETSGPRDGTGHRTRVRGLEMNTTTFQGRHCNRSARIPFHLP